jgi:hypothetical protein
MNYIYAIVGWALSAVVVVTRAAIVALSTFLLCSCAKPPGWVAASFNANDPCQSRNRPAFCGASQVTGVIRTPVGQPVLFITKP